MYKPNIILIYQMIRSSQTCNVEIIETQESVRQHVVFAESRVDNHCRNMSNQSYKWGDNDVATKYRLQLDFCMTNDGKALEG